MPKFFMPVAEPQPAFLTLTGENAAHAKVLRLKPGDTVTVCDGNGTDHTCTISDLSQGQVSLVVRHSAPTAAEAKCAVRIFLAFAKADKLEHVVQKATELGAAEVIAFPSKRCVSTPDAGALTKKLARWNKIAASAAAQSGRGRIPAVTAAASFDAAVAQAAQAELPVLFYENEQRRTFREAIGDATFASAALMTGPEGGFTSEEIQTAQQAGLQICTLGPRILRCETAPLCALSALLYATGEF